MTQANIIPVQIADGQVEELSADDLEQLRQAVVALERPNLIGRLNAMASKQMAAAGKLVSEPISRVSRNASRVALRAALHAALASLPRRDDRKHPDLAQYQQRQHRLHKRLAMATGAAGGAFGMIGLAIELPVSTTLILRSIIQIAQAEGEDPRDPETALACLEVFALGSGGKDENNSEQSHYFAVRSLLARSLTDAAQFILSTKLIDQSAPVLARLIGQIAARFGLVVSQKMAAQAVPIVGAIGAATLNYGFADYFQRLAQAHFTVRRLERQYGQLLVREHYERIAKSLES